MTEPIRLPAPQRQASQSLIDAYAQSWERIDDAQLSLSNDPLNARKRARLNELQDMVSREVAALDATAKAYVQKQYPKVYTDAATRGAKAVAADALAYVQPNREAAQLLADGLQRQLLEATSHVDQTTKTLVRRIGRDAGLKTAIDGKTAKQAATEMRRILNQSGIHAVTYANGAKVGLKAYTEMAVRTSTALALNQGAIQGSEDAGCLFWEIFDGTSCGFKSHKDPELAHGKVVSRDEALAYPIAHPNCRRAVGPRPDLGVDKKARPAKPTVTQADAAKLADNNTPTVTTGVRAGGGPVPTRAEVEANIAKAQAERAQAAATRAAQAQQKAVASTQARQVAGLPDASPVDADKVYPEYLFDLAKVDKRIKAGQIPGNTLAPENRIRARLDAANFDPNRASEYDLLHWMQEQAGIEGFGDNLTLPLKVLRMTTGDAQVEKRIIRYLVDGGKIPDPLDLTLGATRRDVLKVYPKTDADSFWEPDIPSTATRMASKDYAVDQFDEIWGQPELTAAQSAALRAYSRGSDKAINSQLRKGGKGGAKVDAIRAAMRPIPRSVTVRRGVDADAFGYKEPVDEFGGIRPNSDHKTEFLNKLIGQNLEDPGFLSTSVNPRGAFAGEVEMVIDVPEGYRGAWVEPFSSSPGEAELLLDRGTRLEVYEVVRSGENGRLVQLRARVVHQDDAYDYDPVKAAEARAGHQTTPETQAPLPRTTTKPVVRTPAAPSKLPPPPPPEVPPAQAKPTSFDGPKDPTGGLPFDVPKRPNGITKAAVKIDKIGVDGTVFFEDGTQVKVNGSTWRNGTNISQGGAVRARWVKAVGKLWYDHNGGW